MKLTDWYHAMKLLRQLAQKHGHTSIPIPEAMEALQADSRATFYRRLAELRDAEWFAVADERNQTVHLLAPEQTLDDTVEQLRKDYWT